MPEGPMPADLAALRSGAMRNRAGDVVGGTRVRVELEQA